MLDEPRAHRRLERAVQVSGLAERLGLPDEPSLSEIVEQAPAPWRDILAEHRDALRVAADEVDQLTAANRALLEAAYLASAALVASGRDSLMPDVRVPEADVRKRPKRRPASLDDTRLTELRDEELAWLAALATSASLGLQPSLREFLR